MNWLIPAFFLTALLYASIGFGGGSTYTALLALADTRHEWIAPISLLCNLTVVSGNTYRFARAGLVDWKECGSYLALSIPAAWYTGTLQVPRSVFFGLLGAALIGSAIAMWLRIRESTAPPTTPALGLRLALGGVLGVLAGLVGIGGGIFLAPCLHLLRAAPPKRIAAISTVFIAANSVAGFVGHTSRFDDYAFIGEHLWLFAGVLVGGQLGNWMSIRVLSPRTLRLLTSALVLYVGLRLLVMTTN